MTTNALKQIYLVMKNPTKEWYDIMIEYWTQIAILLGVIVFCVEKFIELKLKKEEIQFSRLHENKILEIKLYYKSYQSLKNSLQKFYDQTVYGKHSKEIFDEINKDITEKFIEFDYNSMTIKLFIDSDKLVTLDEITKMLYTIRNELMIWHINANPNNSTNIPDNLEKVETMLKKTLPDLIKSIEDNLRKNFISK